MTRIQELLDLEARLGNEGMNKSHPFFVIVVEEIKQLRGTEQPACFGYDDCSTSILVQCPWRLDCGDQDELR